MNRPVRHPAQAFAAGRRLPPLPHPSWFDADRRDATSAREIAPDEFWKRLGL